MTTTRPPCRAEACRVLSASLGGASVRPEVGIARARGGRHGLLPSNREHTHVREAIGEATAYVGDDDAVRLGESLQVEEVSEVSTGAGHPDEGG